RSSYHRILHNGIVAEHASVASQLVPPVQLPLRIAWMRGVVFRILRSSSKVPFPWSFGRLSETGFLAAMIASMRAPGTALPKQRAKLRSQRAKQRLAFCSETL